NESVIATQWGEWRPRGGHRLWAAPEAMPRSYAPDNDAVEFEFAGDRAVRLLQHVEPQTKLQKEITVELDAEGTGVRLTHRITNRGLWPVELAPWALTIMRGGGEAIIPQEPYGPHPEFLLPTRQMVLWPYTDLSDPRWTLGRRLVRLRTDDARAEPQKLGVANKRGWAAYRLGETLFVKRFAYAAGARYPDLGCNCELFTAASFIEVESLAPLTQLEPGATTEHAESWQLFDAFKAGESDEELDDALRPLVEA
ncbi:MAG TPA: hypothetical protein VFX96_07130, partial [Pyrinomonadaceae bacterium]|nr:hypothetical protein [Pyrinomonadaceae bacterium]